MIEVGIGFALGFGLGQHFGLERISFWDRPPSDEFWIGVGFGVWVSCPHSRLAMHHPVHIGTATVTIMYCTILLSRLTPVAVLPYLGLPRRVLIQMVAYVILKDSLPISPNAPYHVSVTRSARASLWRACKKKRVSGPPSPGNRRLNVST